MSTIKSNALRTVISAKITEKPQVNPALGVEKLNLGQHDDQPKVLFADS